MLVTKKTHNAVLVENERLKVENKRLQCIADAQKETERQNKVLRGKLQEKLNK